MNSAGQPAIFRLNHIENININYLKIKTNALNTQATQQLFYSFIPLSFANFIGLWILS